MSATLEVGSALGPWTVPDVDPEKMKVFAVVLADPNPIHLDPAAVKAAGLGDRVINQGPASFGYVLNMLRESAPGAEIRDLDVRLSANVFGGDTVVAAGEVDSAEDVEGARRLVCKVWLDVEGGRRALQGTATLVVPTSA
jgi:3-hydroxybutyryl-CoA dehydratase